MGEGIRSRLRRNAREPYTWLTTAMGLLAATLYVAGHKGLWLLVLALEATTFVVDRVTVSAARSQQ